MCAELSKGSILIRTSQFSKEIKAQSNTVKKSFQVQWETTDPNGANAEWNVNLGASHVFEKIQDQWVEVTSNDPENPVLIKMDNAANNLRGIQAYLAHLEVDEDQENGLKYFDRSFKVEILLNNGGEIIFELNCYYKPDGNPGTEGDMMRPVKP